MNEPLPAAVVDQATIPWRVLGRTKHLAPALGFGVTGAHTTPLVPPEQTESLVRQAIGLGVTLFDTAPLDAEGEGERRLGAAIKGAPRNQLFLCTKVGSRRDGMLGKVRKDFRPDAVRASVEQSLNRLGVDHLDAVFLHGPSPSLIRPLLKTLRQLKKDKLTKMVGICGRGPDIEFAIKLKLFNVVMTPVRRDMSEEARDRLLRVRDAGMGVIGIETLAPSQRILRMPKRPADVWYLARGLAKAARRTGETPQEPNRPSPASCLEWSIRSGLADAVVVTTVRPAHLQECADSVRRALA